VQHVAENIEVIYAAAHQEVIGRPWKHFPPMAKLAPGFKVKSTTLKERRIPNELAGLPAEGSWHERCQYMYMRMTRHNFQDVLNVCRSYFVHHCASHEKFEHGTWRTRHFDFANFIRISLDEMLEELIEFSHWSWLWCMLYFGILCLLAEYLPSGENVEYVMMGFSMMMIVVFIPMYLWVDWQVNNMFRDYDQRMAEVVHHHDDVAQDAASIQMEPVTQATEDMMRQLLQTANFLNSYCLARILGAIRYYDGLMFDGSKQWILAIYLIAYVFNGYMLLPRLMPWFTILHSLPPYMSEEDFERLALVMKKRVYRIQFDSVHGALLLQRRSPKYLADHNLHEYLSKTLEQGNVANEPEQSDDDDYKLDYTRTGCPDGDKTDEEIALNTLDSKAVV